MAEQCQCCLRTSTRCVLLAAVVAGDTPPSPCTKPIETALDLLGEHFLQGKQVYLTQLMLADSFLLRVKDGVRMQRNMKLWLVMTAHV